MFYFSFVGCVFNFRLIRFHLKITIKSIQWKSENVFFTCIIKVYSFRSSIWVIWFGFHISTLRCTFFSIFFEHVEYSYTNLILLTFSSIVFVVLCTFQSTDFSLPLRSFVFVCFCFCLLLCFLVIFIVCQTLWILPCWWLGIFLFIPINVLEL